MRCNRLGLPLLALTALATILGVVSAQDGESRREASAQPERSERRSRALFYVRDITPLLAKAGCSQAACHGSTKGKGGLRLSLFGADPQADYEALSRAAKGRRIDRIEPSQSLLVVKSSGGLAHGGKRRIAADSPQYDALVAWIAQGARFDDPALPKPIALQLNPAETILEKDASSPLSATAVFSDGTKRDVTGEVTYRSSDPLVARVGSDGAATAVGFGEAVIVATYLRRSATARVVVPQPLPEEFPKVAAHHKIDELVLSKLEKLGLPPSDLCSDEVFVRRVYLDLIGLLPSAVEARAFLADRDPQKRRKVIDRLLEREEFADVWAMKWGDLLKIKSEYPSRLWPKAVQTYYEWLRESIATNKPYDRLVRELLVASGSNFRVGPANYYRALPVRDPQTIAESTAMVFMGMRIGCARCHGHPTEDWSAADNLGLAAYFARVSYKPTAEWKEEVVYSNADKVLRNPRTKEIILPKIPGEAAVGNTAPAVVPTVVPAAAGGAVAIPAATVDPREQFADWLLAPGNPWFAKNVVNRIWFWLLGRGIVHEPDDLRLTNPPENPELLAYLERELVEHRYDLKHIYRLIANSRTYQLASKPNRHNGADTSHFSHYRVKRLGAEQMLDAIAQITGVPDKFTSRIPEPFAVLPSNYRATQLADGNFEESPFAFLELFGRPPRDTSYERERCTDTSLRQALYLVNSEHLEGKIVGSRRIADLMKSGKSDAEIVEELYLAMFSRLPTEKEKNVALRQFPAVTGARTQALRDFVWALFNTKEFLFNH